MADEKPKHKPQARHTLSEVLNSLQDLIRNDLAAAQAAKTMPPAGKAQAAPPASGSEPDSFNRALETLDEIINKNIIEPVERAQQTPPAPPAPDDALEIEWEDTAEPAAENTEKDVEFDLEGDIEFDPEDIRFEPVEPPSAEAAGRPADEEMDFEPFASHVEEPAEPTRHIVDPSTVEAAESQTAESDAGNETRTPPGPSQAAVKREPEAPDARPREKLGGSEPQAPAGAPPKPAQTQSPAAPDPELPVLKEVAAEIPQSPPLPLPEAAQAREIAIRVIARLNIERRRAGEAPLEIKTIERLQQYLAEALTRRALNKPK